MSRQEIFSRLDRQAYTSPAYTRPGSERWLFAIRTFERVFHKRGELLIGVNNIMRILDDIADGDLPPPDGYTSISYLQRKREFIQNQHEPEDELDHYLKYCTNVARLSGFEIEEELGCFFTYFLFDAARLGTGRIFPQADLDVAFNACARGTIGGMLKVFGESENKVEFFLPLGRAVLTHYTLRDFNSDITHGLANISLEAFSEHGIKPKGPFDRFSPGVRSWFNSQAVLGLNLLEQHRQTVRNIGLPLLLKRVILPTLYEKPARAYFKGVLAGGK